MRARVKNVPYAEVIGDPVAHSKSPLIHKFWLEKLRLDADYRAQQVSSRDLATYFASRREDQNWLGCSVTTPHKVAALGMIDEVRAEARMAGATNCVFPRGRNLIARNTDCNGISAVMRGVHYPICVIGSGGAARAALAVLAHEQETAIRLLVRDVERGFEAMAEQNLIGDVFHFGDAPTAFQGCRGIVNTSLLGMYGQAEMPSSLLQALHEAAPDAQVFDLVYAPRETALLTAARALHMVTRDGLEMLVEQAAVAFEIFFQRLAPREHDAELRELMVR